ncbi:MAG: hypothetical protein PVH39_00760, partial [Syntrophobacterales bacterium]
SEAPLQKGGFQWDSLQENDYLPPFLKGDRGLPAIALACPLVPRSGRRAQARRAGGFCCAVVFPKATAAYAVYRQN